jgi:hypothetical protein
MRLLPILGTLIAGVFFALGSVLAGHHAVVQQIEAASFSSLQATYVTSEPFGVAPGEQIGGFAKCPSGQIAIGGGGYGSSANPLQSIDASIPRKSPGSSVPNEWAAWFNNGTSTDNSFVVYAVCIPGHARLTSSFVQH